MKYCPKCITQYADDTLLFCLEDGTRLAVSRPGEMPTAILSDTELLTSVRTAKPASDPRFVDSQVTRVSSLEGVAHSAPARSNTATAVVLTAVGMIILFGIVGLVGYVFYLRSNGPGTSNAEPGKNSSSPNVNIANISPTVTPGPSSPANAVTTSAPTPVSVATPPPQIDVSAIRSEVLKEIYGSKSARDSRDLSSCMSYYAETLDRYYTKRGMSRAGVRADKARHFSNYTSMQSDYSNMNVAVGPDGQTVTAVFDKEWNFSGVKTSSGKVQSQLIFKRINGRWLITTERDLKVYYTR